MVAYSWAEQLELDDMKANYKLEREYRIMATIYDDIPSLSDLHDNGDCGDCAYCHLEARADTEEPEPNWKCDVCGLSHDEIGEDIRLTLARTLSLLLPASTLCDDCLDIAIAQFVPPSMHSDVFETLERETA